MATLLPILAGFVLGLIGWSLFGLGAAELGLVAGFDPFRTAEEPPPATTGRSILEWSFPVFALGGAVLARRVFSWLVRPGGAS